MEATNQISGHTHSTGQLLTTRQTGQQSSIKNLTCTSGARLRRHGVAGSKTRAHLKKKFLAVQHISSVQWRAADLFEVLRNVKEDTAIDTAIHTSVFIFVAGVSKFDMIHMDTSVCRCACVYVWYSYLLCILSFVYLCVCLYIYIYINTYITGSQLAALFCSYCLQCRFNARSSVCFRKIQGSHSVLHKNKKSA